MDVNSAAAKGEENCAQTEEGAFPGQHGSDHCPSESRSQLPWKPARPDPFFFETLPFDLDPTIPPPLSSPSISSPPLPPPPPPPPCHPPHRRPAPPGGVLPRPHQGGLLGSLLSPHPLPLGNRVSLRSSSPHFSAKDHSSESHLLPAPLHAGHLALLRLLPRPPAPPARPPPSHLLRRPLRSCTWSCPPAAWTRGTHLLCLPLKNSSLASWQAPLHRTHLLPG